jgi:CRP-like cAMP-binding protein
MDRDQMIETLSSFTLFGGLTGPELESMVHRFDEEFIPAGQRVVRQGFSGTGFYVILEGDASVQIDGEERAKISRGECFGELSVLLDEDPIADVIATTPLRVLVLPRSDLAEVITAYPEFALRMIQLTLRRLRSASRWRP